VGVVEVSFFFIVEDFVGLLGALEADFGFDSFFFGDFVGVVR